MRINKLLLLLTFFSSFGIFAGDLIKIHNKIAYKIKVYIIDQNENIYESKIVPSGTSVTLTECSAGRILLVDWGQKEKDGRPNVVGLSFTTEKGCGRNYNFTADLEIVEEKDIKLRPFSLSR